jgi:2-hydroxy-3-keto-5-methylthiopentenyl-1-phosphate phosphatase
MQIQLPHHLVSVLCDFDGTISPIDLSNFIFERFSSQGLFYVQQWEEGLIGTREEIDLTFATIYAGPDEIAASLKEVPIDPTFQGLIALSQQHDLGLAVVSDGMDWPIEIVLANYGITGVPVYSNHMFFTDERPVCTYPWYDPSTPMNGVCKPLVIRQYRRISEWIVFIGDGRSDQAAAREADLVFAKDALADFCRDEGIAALDFNTFSDVCTQLVLWLAHIKNGPATGKPPVQ